MHRNAASESIGSSESFLLASILAFRRLKKSSLPKTKPFFMKLAGWHLIGWHRTLGNSNSQWSMGTALTSKMGTLVDAH